MCQVFCFTQENFMECVYMFDDDGSQVSNSLNHTDVIQSMNLLCDNVIVDVLYNLLWRR